MTAESHTAYPEFVLKRRDVKLSVCKLHLPLLVPYLKLQGRLSRATAALDYTNQRGLWSRRDDFCRVYVLGAQLHNSQKSVTLADTP